MAERFFFFLHLGAVGVGTVAGGAYVNVIEGTPVESVPIETAEVPAPKLLEPPPPPLPGFITSPERPPAPPK
jgi:hypothetical protein